MSQQGEWRNDTVDIIGAGATVTVKAENRPAADYGSLPVARSGSLGFTVIETSTVLIIPSRGDLTKDEKGETVRKMHDIYFPWTSSVAVTHKIFESGVTDYYEAVVVKKFEDHIEVSAVQVKGR